MSTIHTRGGEIGLSYTCTRIYVQQYSISLTLLYDFSYVTLFKYGLYEQFLHGLLDGKIKILIVASLDFIYKVF
jgi:hypothetical protein